MGIELYSTVAAGNNAAPPSGWPEGMAPSAVNDTGRQMMADIRAWYEAAEWINFGLTHAYVSGTAFSIGGGVDRTATYHVGRRIRAQGAATGTIYGTISAASYAAPTTSVTVAWDSGTLQNETLAVALWILSASTAPAVLARSGTKLLFPQLAAAPVGWTIDATWNQATIRVMSAASATSGGTVDFTTAFASGSTGAYALTAGDMPSHQHDLQNHTHGYSDSTTDSISTTSVNVTQSGGTGVLASASPSNSDHGRTTAAPSVNLTGLQGGGGAHSHALGLAVRYLDACVCTKV